MKSIWIGLWNHKTSSNILNPALDYSRYRSGTALWKYTNVINWSILIEVFLWYNPHKGLIEINLWVFFLSMPSCSMFVLAYCLTSTLALVPEKWACPYKPGSVIECGDLIYMLKHLKWIPWLVKFIAEW